MGAIGWIWASVMLLGGMRAHMAQSLPPELVWALIASGLFAMPMLWDRENGLLGGFAPSGIVRAGLALLVLVVAGISYPSATMGLIA
jgi:hypothetical protein